FEKHYADSFLKRFGWADDAPAKNRLERGLKQGQDALDRGQHTSVAGTLRSVAERYMLTGHSEEAELFVALWDLYAKSAVADPRKYGGPWGFDSDFPSAQVVAGWDLIEDDPVLTDEQRLRTTKSMGRWLAEAVIPKCAGAASGTRVPHNHQTFPGLGALFAGLYFSQHYDVAEGRLWLGLADAMFQRQAGYFKPYEDCNGYQWLTNGHLMRYCLARPDFTLFENGNGQRIIDYLIGTMDNLGYQVPYGDTGSWQCWNSEMVCLDMFAHATGSPEARWAANRKRALKNTLETHAFYQLEPGTCPDRFNGVMVWPLEPQYAATHPAEDQPPLERCFDKITFREALHPDAAYLLLDGLSNGGHHHLDGNSLPRLTLFDRIWLADNDYFKAPVKFHNSVTVFRDGQSAAIPPCAELVAAGQSPRYGYSRTRLANYAGVDWTRTIIWLRQQQAFAVLDRLTALDDNEYQFRTLWHGVGAAKLSDDGLLLTQKGPSLWVQIAPGPVLELHDDAELGANWRGYEHAEPVVRSLEAVSTVKLAKGESYLFASVLHGKADGIAEPWGLDFLDRADGVRLSTADGVLDLVLDPARSRARDGSFETDAQCMVVSGDGLTLLGATRASSADRELLKSAEPASVDLDAEKTPESLRKIALRRPVPNLVAAADAPPHPIQWCVRPNPVRGGDKAASAAPWHFSRLASAALDEPGRPDAVLAATTEGMLFALNADGSTRWSFDAGAQLNDVVADDLTGDGKDEIILARQDGHVQVLSGAGEELWKRALAYYRRPPYVNVVRTGDIDGDGTPEVIAGGENWRFYAFRADGTELWNYESVHPSRSGAIADLDGDGKAEVICGTHYYWASVLNADGQRRWQYSFGPICYDIATGRFDRDGTRGVVFGSGDGKIHAVDSSGKPRLAYTTGDEVQHVAAADLDGDGLDEILAGSLNYNVYCFGADASRRWRRDLGGPVSALATVPQQPGALVVVGTAKGRLASVDATGRVRAITELGSEILDLVADRQSVIVATADGQLRKISAEPAGLGPRSD
ncbi:MAG TPA: PQQ-binding-like beta-propeller repeat protein, partial [Candidatus Anammoximicrobium sp.]|nr:PQQ-binding-like beta-propeller repeat protein [Candidatus Anammoximicrobium sp.]